MKNIYVFKKRIEWEETKIGWLFAWYVWEKGYEGDINIKFMEGGNSSQLKITELQQRMERYVTNAKNHTSIMDGY